MATRPMVCRRKAGKIRLLDLGASFQNTVVRMQLELEPLTKPPGRPTSLHGNELERDERRVKKKNAGH